jgi:predicted ATPase
MLKELKIKHWKSFEEATLYIDPLTVLIGLNASGKSNVLDALTFLQRTVAYRDLHTALAGDRSLPEIRGGVDWTVLRGYTSFELEVKLSGDSSQTDFIYSIEIELIKKELVIPVVKKEILTKVAKNGKRINLFWTEPYDTNQPFLTIKTYNGKSGVARSISNSISALAQVYSSKVNEEIRGGVDKAYQALKNIFILDPIPQNARRYVSLSPDLALDGSNIAGVIASMSNGQKVDFEKIITKYAAQLPEREIKKVEALRFGPFEKDAILVCEEEFVKGKTQTVDSRGLSDGTLRFLAILTAILTRPAGSLLVVEEFDNGIHPSRAGLMLDMLQEEGRNRGVDVLVTTHNPAFLNEMGPEMIPFVVLSHRDTESGLSKLTQIEDLPNLTKLLGKGLVGDWIAKGYLQEEISKIEQA